MNIFIYLHNWDHSLNSHINYFLIKLFFIGDFGFTAKWSKWYRDFPSIPCPSRAVIKKLPANAGDMGDVGSVPGLGRSPGGGHGNPLQYSSLKNFLDRRTWRGIVHGVTESWTQLSEHTKLTLNFPHQGGTLVTLNESTLTHPIHSACYGSLLVGCVLCVWING